MVVVSDLFRDTCLLGPIQQTNYSGKGTAYVATQTLNDGDFVMKIPQPLVATVDTANLEAVCHCCFKQKGRTWGNDHLNPATKTHQKQLLGICTSCKVPRYCSKKCQSRDWKLGHKYECKIFAEDRRSATIPAPVRALLRLLLLMKHEDVSGFVGRFWTLESHWTELKFGDLEKYETTIINAKWLRGKVQTQYSEMEVVRAMCIFYINSATLQSVTGDPIGMYLDPSLARINHACDYNTAVYFNPYGDVALLPIREISAGEEITVGYINCTMPFERRQAELRERYFFDCECSFCLEQYSVPGSTAENWPRNPNLDIKAIESQADSLLKWSVEHPSHPRNVKVLRYGLHILAAVDWPIARWPYAELRQNLMLAYLADQQFDSAYMHALILWRRVNPERREKNSLMIAPAPRLLHPTDIMHACLLLELTYFMFEGARLHGGGGENIFKYLPNGESTWHLPVVRWRLYLQLNDLVQRQHNWGQLWVNIDEACRKILLGEVRMYQWFKGLSEEEKDHEWEKIDFMMDKNLEEEKMWDESVPVTE